MKHPTPGKENHSQVYNVSGNALEGKKCLQDLSKDLTDFTLNLP